MSLKAEPWQTAEIAGPKKALLILKAEVVVALVKRATKPLLIVGHLATEAGTEYDSILDYAIRIHQATDIPVVATAHTEKEFSNRGFQSTACMSAMDIGNRLQDPSWMGIKGLGSHDLALFMGLPYYMEFVLLSGLKHFNSNLKTVSLYRFYNPHATWSFPNLKVKDWQASIEIILRKLNEK
jgi:acetyl-CoA decarbonylase/synthase complex subunit epsilon